MTGRDFHDVLEILSQDTTFHSACLRMANMQCKPRELMQAAMRAIALADRETVEQALDAIRAVHSSAAHDMARLRRLA